MSSAMASAEASLLAPTPEFAVDADSDFHFIDGKLERRLACGRHGAWSSEATPNDRVLVHLAAESCNSASLIDCSAPAPQFSTTRVPATPRLPVDQVEFGTATSSFVTTVMIFRPSARRSSPAISKFMTSPSCLDDQQGACAASTASMAAAIWFGVGDVNTWPGQAASSMPRPTKPACKELHRLSHRGDQWRPCRVRVRWRTNFRSAPSSIMSACAAASHRGFRRASHRLHHQPLHSDFLRLGPRSNAPASVLQQSPPGAPRGAPYSAIKASTAWLRRRLPQVGMVRLITRIPAAGSPTAPPGCAFVVGEKCGAICREKCKPRNASRCCAGIGIA